MCFRVAAADVGRPALELNQGSAVAVHLSVVGMVRLTWWWATVRPVAEAVDEERFAERPAAILTVPTAT